MLFVPPQDVIRLSNVVLPSYQSKDIERRHLYEYVVESQEDLTFLLASLALSTLSTLLVALSILVALSTLSTGSATALLIK